MNSDNRIWQTKLLAWIHDPAEKALVLLRDPAGHEGGTTKALAEKLFPKGLPDDLVQIVKQADRWAAAADRPQFPRESEGGRFQSWTQVRFDESPVLIHPLSGEEIEIKSGFGDIDPSHIKAISLDHFSDLIIKDGDSINFRKTALCFWRFGPQSPAKQLGALWKLLPADTRAPDHTIWAHLDMASAFASAFSADPQANPALLVMSFGPVQEFIAQARSTSDLWAGSHLLSMIAWEGMKVICEMYGPDAVIFPQLRGVPIVDLWLKKVGLPEDLFNNCAWLKMKSDANPLFAAALPNKFVAIVPAVSAEDVAKKITVRVRAWTKRQAENAISLLLKEGGMRQTIKSTMQKQADDQLVDLPEVHWGLVPWSLVVDMKGSVKTDLLKKAMEAFYPEHIDLPGFLGSGAWALLSSKIKVDETAFFNPNPGVLYPAFYDLLDRVFSAAKSIRAFSQMPQHGFRCTLCGEREWLTDDRAQLENPPGQRDSTIWSNLASEKSAWAKKGEHLCVICSLKRLWPGIFVNSLEEILDTKKIHRYVVSTHTMALATSIDKWLDRIENGKIIKVESPTFMRLKSQMENSAPCALPKCLSDRIDRGRFSGDVINFIRRLPTFLDEIKADAREPADEIERKRLNNQAEKIEQQVEKLLGYKPEAYYGLIMMDGDYMGAWLSGNKKEYQITYKDSWHPDVRKYAEQIFKGKKTIIDYLETLRPPSPARHMAISEALNTFSLRLARHVVEDIFKGKLLYSGGDDVLAMVSIDDLASVVLLLRLVYSGISIDEINKERWSQLLATKNPEGLKAAKGFVHLHKELFRLMGSKATASVGAVIAHHTAPLTVVLRKLREAEKRAKIEGGRDAFSITLIKRSGGTTQLTVPWFINNIPEQPLIQSSMEVLLQWRDALADSKMSRRAAYLICDWIMKLPSPEMVKDVNSYRDLLTTNIAYQLKRQCQGSSKYSSLGKALVSIAFQTQNCCEHNNLNQFIRDFVSVAEFLAREGRFETKDYDAKEASND
jgi:CRISPR-associated protein Cmr2